MPYMLTLFLQTKLRYQPLTQTHNFWKMN